MHLIQYVKSRSQMLGRPSTVSALSPVGLISAGLNWHTALFVWSIHVWTTPAATRAIKGLLIAALIPLLIIKPSSIHAQTNSRSYNDPLNWLDRLALTAPILSGTNHRTNDFIIFDILQSHIVTELRRVSRGSCQYDSQALLKHGGLLVGVLSPALIQLGSAPPATPKECAKIATLIDKRNLSHEAFDRAKARVEQASRFWLANVLAITFPSSAVRAFMQSQGTTIIGIPEQFKVQISNISSVTYLEFKDWPDTLGEREFVYDHLESLIPPAQPVPTQSCVATLPVPPSTRAIFSTTCTTAIQFSALAELESAYVVLCPDLLQTAKQNGQTALCEKLNPFWGAYWIVSHELRGPDTARCLID